MIKNIILEKISKKKFSEYGDIIIQKSKPDMIINTSCEHMFPMTRFKKLNRRFVDSIYSHNTSGCHLYVARIFQKHT